VRLLPKALLSESALAWVISAKYQDSLPLYRQAALLGRPGGDLSRNTLAASVVRVSGAGPEITRRHPTQGRGLLTAYSHRAGINSGPIKPLPD